MTGQLHVFCCHRPAFYDKNHQIIKTMWQRWLWTSNSDNSLRRQNVLYEGTEAVISICALFQSTRLLDYFHLTEGGSHWCTTWHDKKSNTWPRNITNWLSNCCQNWTDAALTKIKHQLFGIQPIFYAIHGNTSPQGLTTKATEENNPKITVEQRLWRLRSQKDFS